MRAFGDPTPEINIEGELVFSLNKQNGAACCCLNGGLKENIVVNAGKPNQSTVFLNSRGTCEEYGGVWIEGNSGILDQDGDPIPLCQTVQNWNAICPACCCSNNGKVDAITKPECEALPCPGTWFNMPCDSVECPTVETGACCVHGEPDPAIECRQACDAAGGTWFAGKESTPQTIPGGSASNVICGPASCCWEEPQCVAVCLYCNNRTTGEYTLVGGDPECPATPGDPGGTRRMQLIGPTTWCQGQNPICEDENGQYFGVAYGIYDLARGPNYCLTGDPGDQAHWANCTDLYEQMLRGVEQYQNVSYKHNRGCTPENRCG